MKKLFMSLIVMVMVLGFTIPVMAENVLLEGVEVSNVIRKTGKLGPYTQMIVPYTQNVQGVSITDTRSLMCFNNAGVYLGHDVASKLNMVKNKDKITAVVAETLFQNKKNWRLLKLVSINGKPAKQPKQ